MAHLIPKWITGHPSLAAPLFMERSDIVGRAAGYANFESVNDRRIR